MEVFTGICLVIIIAFQAVLIGLAARALEILGELRNRQL